MRVVIRRIFDEAVGGDFNGFEVLACFRIWSLGHYAFSRTHCKPTASTRSSPIADLTSKFASPVISNIGYDKFQIMLYGAPSGAVLILFVWIGVLACHLFPNKRCLIVMLLVTVPLIGNILLLKLSLSAGWGMIVASWLASVTSDIFSITLSLSASNVK